MKTISRIVLILIVALVAFTSCQNKDVEIGTREQLVGRWQSQSGQDFIVFTNEDAGEGYAWGMEWNADETLESDLEELDFHGNGWFKWKKGGDYITARNMMSISEAEAAVDWKLYELNDSRMQLAQKAGKIVTYNKVQQ